MKRKKKKMNEKMLRFGVYCVRDYEATFYCKKFFADGKVCIWFFLGFEFGLYFMDGICKFCL